MADVEKKARLSGEQTRVAEPATTLPTANVLPTTEKAQPPKPALHPAFYVVYVLPDSPKASSTDNSLQYVDWLQWWCHIVQ